MIHASAKAAIEDSTIERPCDEIPKGKRKPTRTDHLGLIKLLWRFFLSADPRKADKIQWDRTNNRYTGTFYEFSKEVFSMAGISLSDTYLARLVKKVMAEIRRRPEDPDIWRGK